MTGEDLDKSQPTEQSAKRPYRRRTKLGAVTSDERDAPYTDDPRLLELEKRAAESRPDQLPLFMPGPSGDYTPLLGGLPVLESSSSLELARAWYRRDLELKRRPENTIESYCYDLVKLEERTGSIAIDRISRADIAEFLGLANTKSTRKRRLTSVRRFFTYLISDAKVLDADPTEGFYPHSIQLKAPLPLFADEQSALLTAAADDEPWSLAAIWLMMRMGLARAELLALRREHIDLSVPAEPVVHIVYDEISKRSKERRIGGDAEFATIYADFLERRATVDLLFPVGFQAVNGMVERVRKAAGITKEVTPQVLRHTFAVERAKSGADEAALLQLLGLADDPRNRASVRRYIALAEPPL